LGCKRRHARLAEVLESTPDAEETIVLLPAAVDDIVLVCGEGETIKVVCIGRRALDPAVLA
jgi:hypothetical protein